VSDRENVIADSAVIEEGVRIGNNVFIGHNVVIRTGCRIGDDVCIGHNSVLEENVLIGDRTRVQAMVYLTKNTTIDEDVFIAPCVCTANDWNILSHNRGDAVLEGPTIKRGARIGAQALLMPRVIVGENALVGAGSVVASNVAPRTIIHGEKALLSGTVPEEHLI